MDAEGQVVEAHSLVVAVPAARLGLVERKRRQAVAHDPETTEVVAVGEAGERRRRDERVGVAGVRRGYNRPKQLRLRRALGRRPARPPGRDGHGGGGPPPPPPGGERPWGPPPPGAPRRGSG